jgi:hypothetical protein
VYVFDDSADAAAPVIAPVTGTRRLLMLLANTYVGYLLDAAMRRREFEVLSRLASAVHVRRISRTLASNDGADVYSHLRDDYERLRCTASATLVR